MSTRATYEFKDCFSSFTVYKHQDGYPEGGYQWIARAIKLAWALPRFEACDFGSAFVAANKHQAGDVYLTDGRDGHGDTKHHYLVTCEGGVLFVERFEPDGFHDARLWTSEEKGTLEEMLEKYAPSLTWVDYQVPAAT